MPIVTIEAPRLVARKTGNRLWINSEDVSMNSEPRPIAQMPAGRARSVVALRNDFRDSFGRDMLAFQQGTWVPEEQYRRVPMEDQGGRAVDGTRKDERIAPLAHD
jgi:hypothetical protein